MPAHELIIGGSERERLAVRIFGSRSDSTSTTPYDRWLDARVLISVGGFNGDFDCALLPTDFERFGRDLERLREDLTGSAEFTTVEGQLTLRVTGDGLGHFEINGEALDRVGDGNRLTWSLQIDQTQLADMIASAGAIARMFVTG